MRTATIATTLVLSTVFAAEAMAQRGGRGRRPEEITNRVGLFFTDIAGPQSDGDKVADLETLELVRTAVSAKQLSVIYLINESDDAPTRQNFEFQLARDQELGIELRCFHCGRIELSKEAALAERYAKKAPLFVVFDAKGKATEVPMAGYKPSSSALKKALEKAASGTIKPSASAFAKRYGKLIRDLEQLLAKKDQANASLAKAGGNDGKRKKAQKELQKIEADQQKLLDDEKELLAKVTLPERPAGARRIGDRPQRGRGQQGTGGGRGGNGGGNGGG